MDDPIGEIIEAIANCQISNMSKDAVIESGREIGRLYTDHGFPIDMALERIDANRDYKILLIMGAHEWLIEHKRKSCAGEKAIERQRKANRTMMESFIKTGETGAY